MAFATARPTRENIAIGLNLDPKSLVSIAHTLDHGDCLSAQWNYVEIKIFPLDVNDLALALRSKSEISKSAELDGTDFGR
jgi:hypothetical protein